VTFDNNTCNAAGCGKPIIWIHPITRQPSIHPDTGNKRPLNPDGSLHLCMYKGQKQFFEKRKKGERVTDFFKED
jgi:hypothetical protein